MLITLVATVLLAAAGSTSADATAPKPRAAQPLTACERLRKSGATYVLERDVESAGTCFSIEADNITLDLNHHSITYAAKDGSRATYGVLAADCWDKSIAGNPCDGSHRHAIVMNGKIVQGAAAAPMSHALRFGQGNNLTGITVHDLDITISTPDSIGIYGDYLPGGSDIYRNTIHNQVKVISNRHQFRGTSIKLDEEREAKLPDLIHDNIIRGGPHAGIRSDNPAGTRIYNNDISQDANYTNAFCIDAAGRNLQVYGNNCHPIHGRGLHTNASGVKIYGNTVSTIDSGQIEEYQGCEIHGTYGIQAESDGGSPEGIDIYHNQVKVHAAACPAEAVRLTDLKDASIQIHDNTFIAVQDRVAGRVTEKAARGFSVGNVTGSHIEFTRNIVQADTAIFHMDWDAGGMLTLRENTFRAGARGTATLLAEFENGVAPSHDNVFESNIIEGFPPDAARFGDYAGDTWFLVASGMNIHFSDQRGKPLAGARVQSPGMSERQVNSVSDARGDIHVTLPKVRVQNKQPEKKYGALTLTITREGCKPSQIPVPSPQPAKLDLVLACR